MDYSAWLLENRDFSPTRYFALDDLLGIVWVESADDAIHFARKEDAERVAEHGENHDLVIADHLWPGGAPKAPVFIRSELWEAEQPSLQSQVTKLEAENERLRKVAEVAEKFCQRVERGEVRSVRTYKAFREALKESPKC